MKNMEVLGKILGSPARVRIMRLFILNRGKGFTNKEVVRRSRIGADTVRRELRLLSMVGFIKKRPHDWSYNYLFKYGTEFENLLLSSETLSKKTILDNFKKTGKIRLLIVAGIFIKKHDSRVDLLLVGDRLKRNRIEQEVKKIEAEIGVELSYAIFDTKEFIYRLNMYDKLIRDILDYPHEVLCQEKELSTQVLNKL
jgi:hypothetical protein